MIELHASMTLLNPTTRDKIPASVYGGIWQHRWATWRFIKKKKKKNKHQLNPNFHKYRFVTQIFGGFFATWGVPVFLSCFWSRLQAHYPRLAQFARKLPSQMKTKRPRPLNNFRLFLTNSTVKAGQYELAILLNITPFYLLSNFVPVLKLKIYLAHECSWKVCIEPTDQPSLRRKRVGMDMGVYQGLWGHSFFPSVYRNAASRYLAESWPRRVPYMYICVNTHRKKLPTLNISWFLQVPAEGLPSLCWAIVSGSANRTNKDYTTAWAQVPNRWDQTSLQVVSLWVIQRTRALYQRQRRVPIHAGPSFGWGQVNDGNHNNDDADDGSVTQIGHSASQSARPKR